MEGFIWCAQICNSPTVFLPASCPNILLFLTIPTPSASLVFCQCSVSLNSVESKNLNPPQRIRVLTESTGHREVIVPLLQIEPLASHNISSHAQRSQSSPGTELWAARAELGIEVRATHFQISSNTLDCSREILACSAAESQWGVAYVDAKSVLDTWASYHPWKLEPSCTPTPTSLLFAHLDERS